MHRRVVKLCARCRPNVWNLEQQQLGTRSFGSWHENQNQQRQRSRSQPKFVPQTPSPTKGIPHFRPTQQAPAADHSSLINQRLRDYAGQWTNDKNINRLESLGVTRDESVELFALFRKCARKFKIPTIKEYDAATLEQLVDVLDVPKERLTVDRTITRIFIDWLLMPQFKSLYQTSVSQSTFDRIRNIASATDFSYPAEWYPDARGMKRKIIMHVGPTNSGKTHHALRALAAAKSGVYAGPLRLLAHEIWDRLNKGQIIPLGVDPDKEVEQDDTGGADITDGTDKNTPVVTKQANARYVRPCNLLTGEEQRHVADDALLSCTVEMLPLSTPFDVAVVDEIQMISDSARGSGWTAAVLGLCASEIHLCGEETAVGMIQKLVEETGDELVVNRYQRLTPLRVADEALGSLNKVRKGDCVVAFSRTEIYGIKNTIERTTGLRCAVAYGRLPPEIRSEQAALFNDPNSGYDVMVGSDAIGMGLNLKIKRIVFSAVKKYDGQMSSPLSVSQIKQIAGRAGRYGLHGDSNPGGLVTTLNAEDMPALREALDAPIEELTYVGLPRQEMTIPLLYNILPPESTNLSLLTEIHDHLCRLRAPFKLPADNSTGYALAALDGYAKHLTLQDLIFWFKAPVAWRDPNSADVARMFLRAHRDELVVSLSRCMQATGHIRTLDEVHAAQAAGLGLSNAKLKMVVLETMHKAIVLYLWMSLRNSVIFPEYVGALELKERTEKAMDFALQSLTAGRTQKPVARVKNEIAYMGKRDFMLEKQKRREDYQKKLEMTSSLQ